MNSSEYKSIAEFARDAMREKMVAREQHKSLVELKLDDMRRKKRIKQELPDRVSNLEEKFEEILKLLKKK